MEKINSILLEKKINHKESKITKWQDLAVEICKDLKIPAKERSLIFKLCKSNKIIYADYIFLMKKRIFSKSAVRYLLAITKKHND